eukprot:scaffold3267_cov142-Amphora_coffeaeformis.AAC.1
MRCFLAIFLLAYSALVGSFSIPTANRRIRNHDVLVSLSSRSSGTINGCGNVETTHQQDKEAATNLSNGHNPRRRKSPKRKTQLRWISQSLRKMRASGKHMPDGLVEAAEALSNAETQDQVIRIGNHLSNLIEGEPLPPAVQERLIKATATTGLFQLALNLTNLMLADEIIPSEITQDALCSCLRRAGRANQIEKLIMEMGVVARKRSISVSSSSFNIMLAALCDSPDAGRHAKATSPNHVNAWMLQRAWSWIADDKAKNELGINPTSVSYATVLQAAAKTGNRALADQVWSTMQERGIRPNPFAYNAILKLAGKGGMKREEEILQIWENMRKDGFVEPDRYTVDLVLPALARRGDVEEILDSFILKNSQYVVSNSFAAFLITLNNAGETKMAQELFEKYVKPYFAPFLSGGAGSLRLVNPMTKHFNIILDGYRQEIDMILKSNTANDEMAFAIEKRRAAAWELYIFLLSNPITQPDEFTYSTMMGLASSSEKICELITGAIERFGNLSSVLQRAALTAMGELGDASSACWLFGNTTLPSPRTKIREWNVLLGALSKASQFANTTTIDLSQAPAVSLDPKKASQSRFLNTVDGFTPSEAAANILQLLIQGSGETQAVKPDSQSFTLVATALQQNEMNSTRALSMFRQAHEIGIPADGRFVNSILRCFGQDVKAAVNAWKEEIRPACLRYENRDRLRPQRSQGRTKGKNLVAAYNGLIYCAGRALRPDIGLRLVYAMVKEGLEPNEVTLNSYRSGKRLRQSMIEENLGWAFARKLALLDPYESLLLVECTKYDRNDRRRDGERRVRIII